MIAEHYRWNGEKASHLKGFGNFLFSKFLGNSIDEIVACRGSNGIWTSVFPYLSGISVRSLGFFAFREGFYETQARRILAATFPRTAAAVAPRSAADYPVQLVSIRGTVPVYAVGSDLLAQQRWVYLHGYAENWKARWKTCLKQNWKAAVSRS